MRNLADQSKARAAWLYWQRGHLWTEIFPVPTCQEILLSLKRIEKKRKEKKDGKEREGKGKEII